LALISGKKLIGSWGRLITYVSLEKEVCVKFWKSDWSGVRTGLSFVKVYVLRVLSVVLYRIVLLLFLPFTLLVG